MKMSRPWNVAVTWFSHSAARVRLTARAAPPAAATAAGSRPLSGPTNTESPAATATPRLAVPTPGSTTATCTAGGRYGTVCASTAAPRLTSPGGIRWVTSMMSACGAIRAATPWHAATKPSSSP